MYVFENHPIIDKSMRCIHSHQYLRKMLFGNSNSHNTFYVCLQKSCSLLGCHTAPNLVEFPLVSSETVYTVIIWDFLGCYHLCTEYISHQYHLEIAHLLRLLAVCSALVLCGNVQLPHHQTAPLNFHGRFLQA